MCGLDGFELNLGFFTGEEAADIAMMLEPNQESDRDKGLGDLVIT